jgi:hypothetical protein
MAESCFPDPLAFHFVPNPAPNPMQRMRTAKLQTVMNADSCLSADPDERRTRATHSLAEDADMRLLELNGHRPRRSQPLLINAGFHTVEVALYRSLSLWRSGRQTKRLTPVQDGPAHAGVLCSDGHHRPPVASAFSQSMGPSAHRLIGSVLFWANCNTARAPSTSKDRRYGSPALVMRPNRALPPELYWPGTSPSQALS